jgi:hypothetical protein
MYSVVAPRELLTVTVRHAASMVFYTDGSLIDGYTGFAFQQNGKGGFVCKSPAAAYCFNCDTATYWVGYLTLEKVLDSD